MSPALSVVVCCYSEDRWQLLLESLASVRGQAQSVHELIVVVDHNDALLDRLRVHVPDAIVIANDETPGLSGARNAGVRAATGDVIAFLDDDATAARDWSMRLVAPYHDDDVLGVGGRVVPRFESGRPRWLPAEFDWVVGCTYEGHRSSMGPVRNLIGANMSMRRQVFDKIGGFRSDLGRTSAKPGGCEETELCIRATRELGGVMWYAPDAVVHHFVPASRATRSYFRARCMAEGESKATIARVAGRQSGLASERKFAVDTLPRALARELGAGLTGRQPGALARFLMLGTAVAMTSAGYARARLAGSRDVWAPAPDDVAFEPAFLTEIDVDAPEDIRPGPSASGRPYRRAVALVRRHGSPVRAIELALDDDGLDKQRVDDLLASARAGVGGPPSPIVAHRRRVVVDQPLVSVVIATRDHPDALARCIDSLRAMHYENYEVIVVDSASRSSATREVVESIMQSERPVRYVRVDRPGLALAHNRGLEKATGEIVAFTDDDTIVDEHWLDMIVGVFHVDPAIACVTGLIWPIELETVSQGWIESSVGFGKGLVPRRYDVRAARSHDPLFPFAAGKFGSGANMAFRTDVLRHIGGFDTALGTGTRARGGDDLAAFFDVLVNGHVLVYEPGAIVHHAHRPDFESLKRQATGYGVGLGAYLTHVVVEHPRQALIGVTRFRHAARHFIAVDSAKNVRRPADYPRELVWRERIGLLRGPWSYLRSRLETRKDARSLEVAVPEREPASVLVGS